MYVYLDTIPNCTFDVYSIYAIFYEMYKFLLCLGLYNCHGHNTKYKSYNKTLLANYKKRKDTSITLEYAETVDSIESKESVKPAEKESHTLPDVYSKRVNLQINAGESLLKQLAAFAAEHNIYINALSSIADTAAFQYIFHDKSILEILEMLSQVMEWRLTIDQANVTISRDKPYVFLHTFSALNTKGKSFTKTSASTTDAGAVSTSALAYSDVWREVEQYLMFLTDNTMNNDKMKQKDAMHDAEEEKLITSLSAAAHMTGKTNSYQALAPRYEDDNRKADNKAQDKKGYYIINQHAGIVTLYATQAQHKAFAKYLYRLEEKLNLQVRFEGKVFALNSKNKTRFGLDINKFLEVPVMNYIKGIETKDFKPIFNNAADTNSSSKFNNAADTKPIAIADILSILMQYGTVHTLSNPQITIANNEIGVFKFTTNKIYKRHDIEENTDQTIETNEKNNSRRPRYATTKIIKEHIEKIPVGFTLCIQPSIDPVTGIVYAHVVQRIIGVDDAEHSDNMHRLYPIVSQKEIDTKIRVNPNEWIALGGYITKHKNKDKGIGFFGARANSDNDFEEILLILKGTTIYTQIISWRSRKIQLYSNRS